MLLPFEQSLRGKRVFVTGHSGFTGSWLCSWFVQAGIELFGYSLPSEDGDIALSRLLNIDADVDAVEDDIMNFSALHAAMARFRPDVVIHLAAQPLVRLSYSEPLRTFAVNALGTANVLEAARLVPSVRGIVCITTDKVYENREWEWGYRENDPLGGKDPYSASKAAAEMVVKGYESLFRTTAGAPKIAVARGGNIIGGGDWAKDRLVPDFVRAVVGETEMTLRFPDATRPWQHVLALVQGYGMLAAGLLSDRSTAFARAWNLGPNEFKQYSVRHVLETLAQNWRRPALRYMDEPLPEAGALALDSRLAFNQLGWRQPWSVEEMVRQTALWYREFYETALPSGAPPGAMRSFTAAQIDLWRNALPDASGS